MRTRVGLLIALVIALLVAGGWFWLRPKPLESAAAVPAAAQAERAKAELVAPAVPVVAPAEPTPRATVAVSEATPKPEPEPEPVLARVRGRCIAKESGAPLAGCTVTFDGMPRNLEELERHGEVDWHDPAPVVTGADGRFEIAFDPPPPYQHGLDVQAPGRVPRTARWGAFAPGQIEDLGDLELALGYGVEGLVVDTQGAPLEGAFAALNDLPLPVRSDMAANDTRGGETDGAGYFRIDVPIPAGTWPFDLHAEGYKLVSPDSVTVVEGAGAAPIRVIARKMPAISGQVVDESGAGAARVYVRVVMHRSGRMASDWTDRDGRFTIHAVDDEPVPVRFEVDLAEGFEPLAEPTQEYAWGTTDVRIELRRARSFELVVVERGSGAPVEDYSVTCEHVRQNGWSSRDRLTIGGRHPGGRMTVTGVARGKNRLVVQPKDALLAASEPQLLEIGDEALPEVRVELARLELCDVRVVDATKHPVAGSKVELVRLGGDTFDADSWLIDTRPGRGSFSGDLGDMHQILADAESDERGLARLPFPGAATKLGLRVTGATHPTTIVADARFPSDGAPLEVIVAPGGRIAGKLRVAGYATGELGVEFELVGSRSNGAAARTEVGVDGTFTSGSLPPGEYELCLSLEHRLKREHGSSGWQLRLSPALATATVVDGKTTELVVDGSALDAGEVHGTVVLNGAPSGACRVRLIREDTRFGHFVPDAQGRFVATHLPPGTWSAEIVVGDYKTSEGDVIGSAATFELAPGAIVTRDFAFERRRATLRVLDADGRPLADTAVEVFDLASHDATERRTDSHGALELDPAPTGGFRLQTRKFQSAPQRLPDPPGAAPLEVRLDLPTGW
ncbi:MAG: carboxypeptidase-like regulatory domain-containing protein [Planctomycetes bacterium]|nr:carboxypeptidase-like regulatory domain-containing protein [Planctomycetota bacterium]